MLIPPLHCPEVRDLAWAVFGRPLLDPARLTPRLAAPQSALSKPRLQWLQALDRHPQALQMALLRARESGRLGLYFEALWQFFLRSDPAFELLAHNLPVHHEGRTLGEFDCLYRCRDSGEVVHLELALKYYLAYDGRWLGPNARDRLDLKLSHMLQRQLQLGAHPAAVTVLQGIGIDRPPQRALQLSGQLFQAAGHAAPWPAALSPHHCGGVWWQIEALHLHLAEHPEGRYRLLSRLEWLAPAECKPSAGLDSDALLTQLAVASGRHAAPRLVAALNEQGREQTRFFVCPPGWPRSPGNRCQQTRGKPCTSFD